MPTPHAFAQEPVPHEPSYHERVRKDVDIEQLVKAITEQVMAALENASA